VSAPPPECVTVVFSAEPTDHPKLFFTTGAPSRSPRSGRSFPIASDGRCVFEQLSTATLLMRPGFITAEFFELAGNAERDHAEEARLDEMKAQLAQRILAVSAEDVYELV
jgi:hypothetical protein